MPIKFERLRTEPRRDRPFPRDAGFPQETAPEQGLTASEKRTLERLQIKWARGRITEEEKQYALVLGDRAWRAARTA